MRLILTTCTILALSAVSTAQTYKSSPNGYLSTEGEDRAYIMFEWSNARTMFLDGEMRNSVMFVKEVAFRYDNRSYTSSLGMGRNWKNMTLDVAPCDYAKPSFTFSKNPTSTPVRVFSGSVTLPTQIGTPSTKPASFSMAFPFGTNHLHNGSKDICLDFDFNGGTMANGARWSTSYYRSYYLDAPSAGNESQGRFTAYGTGCKDSGLSRNSYCWVTSYVYNGKYTGNTAWRDNYRIFSRSNHTPKNAPVIHAISLFGKPNGVSIPTLTCEKLYLDLGQWFVQLGLTGNGSTTVYSQDFLVPYQKAAEGLKVYAQAAYADSSTGQFSLTLAEDTALPAYPKIFKRGCLWQTDTTQKGSSAISIVNGLPLQGPVTDATHNPVIRYGQ